MTLKEFNIQRALGAFNVRDRVMLAENKDTCESILKLLGGDKILVVRTAVARNTSTPAVTLALLSCYDEVSICIQISRNTSTPTDVLRALAISRWSDVRKYANDNLRKMAEKIL